MEIKLKSITFSEVNGPVIIYNVKAPLNKKISVDQDLTLRKVGTDWFASMDMDEFPGQKTPMKAAMKLGAWLKALGTMVEQGHYGNIDLNAL